jgi:hypothetical protein
MSLLQVTVVPYKLTVVRGFGQVHNLEIKGFNLK